MELTTYLKQLMPLTDAMEVSVDQAFDREEHPKGYLLLLPENRSQMIFFFEKGLARTYYVKEDGREITHYFFKENSFSMNIDSIFYGKESLYGLELIEPSVIRSISYPDLEKLIDLSPQLEKVIRLLLIDMLKAFSNRFHALLFQSAQERYNELLEQQPDILQRAPLGYIASYLGITQQTLSVIRAQR